MDALIHLLGELVFSVVSMLVGFALGCVVFALVRLGRWTLIGADRSTEVRSPDGAVHLVRIALLPDGVRFWASRRLFRMQARQRRARVEAGVGAAGVRRDEIAHPKRMVDATDDAAGMVAIVVLAFTCIALGILVLEAMLALVLAAAVLVVRMLWGRWTCEVIDADGRATRLRAPSLRACRALRGVLLERLSRGDPVDDV